MAYDEDLADRTRELLAGEDDLTEQKMMGGLAFLVAGKMAMAVSGEGGIMVRVDPDESEQAHQDDERRAHGDARRGDAGLVAHR